MSINSINFTGHKKHRSAIADVATASAMGAGMGFIAGRCLTKVKPIEITDNFEKKIVDSLHNSKKEYYTKTLSKLEKQEAEMIKNWSNDGSSDVIKLSKLSKKITKLKTTNAEDYAKNIIAETKKNNPEKYCEMFVAQGEKIIKAYGNSKNCIEGIIKEIKTTTGKKYALVGAAALATTAIADKIICHRNK